VAKSNEIKQPGLAAQAGQAVVWNTLFIPAKLAAEIAVTVLQFNILSPAAVGVLALIRASVSSVGIWVDLGIERALPKFIPEVQRSSGRAGVRALIGRVMAIKLAVLLVTATILTLVSDRYLGNLQAEVLKMEKLTAADRSSLLGQLSENGWFFITAIVLLLVLGAVYDVLMAYLISYFRQRAWNSIGLASSLLTPLLIGAALLLGWDVTGVVLAMVITPIFGVALALWQVRQVARTQVAGATQDETSAGSPERVMRRFAPYSALSYLFNMSDYFASAWFAVFVVKDLTDVGLLWAASSLVRQILSYLYMPMVGLQVPLFTRARAGEGGSLPSAYAAVCRILLLMLAPGGVGLVLLARPLVLAQYPGFVNAVPAIVLLTPLLFVESLLATSQNALMVAERYGPIILSRMLAFVSIPLVIVLAPRYGILGAAAAIGGSRVLAGLVVFVAGRRMLQLEFPWRFALRIVLASAVMALGLAPLVGLLPTTLVSQAIGARVMLFGAAMSLVVVGALIFVIVFRLLGGLDARDRQQLAGTRLPLKRLILRVL
jgi:O-antigen/teichoic acid export membrane protein